MAASCPWVVAEDHIPLLEGRAQILNLERHHRKSGCWVGRRGTRHSAKGRCQKAAWSRCLRPVTQAMWNKEGHPEQRQKSTIQNRR